MLIPVCMLVSILDYIRLGTPILFKQTRPGLDAKPITLIKFRSMLEKKDTQGQDLGDADRLTDFG